MGCTTSASNRNVVVSDQLRIERLRRRRSGVSSSRSMLVKGQGPAMQETLGLRNSFPSPASRDMELMAAFHFPSGEQGGRLLQGVFPVLATWNVLTVPPTFASVVA